MIAATYVAGYPSPANRTARKRRYNPAEIVCFIAARQLASQDEVKIISSRKHGITATTMQSHLASYLAGRI